MISHMTLKTRIGEVWVGSTPSGLFWVNLGAVDSSAVEGFFEGRREQGQEVAFQRGGDLIERAGHELQLYLEGRLTRFTGRLDLSGTTAFSRKVWRVTRKIPFGQVRTYAWVAEKVGEPQSVRAVGRALGRNPVPIFVPCHRVVGSGGWLGGFSAGLSIKRWLLALESGQKRLDLGSLEAMGK